ncbi:MAG TPA: DUF3455 domain-containing protein [Gemmatimonadaceae bacterium]|nr:DUF3455 domain-containing protein [Gemmatimonadaceae bacterium]
METASRWMKRSLAIVVASALAAGCAADAPVGLKEVPAVSTNASIADARIADLGVCQNLQVPSGSKLAFRTYAEGVQIYRWSGTSWTFIAPEALLFADAAANATIGSHYAGPTWESVSGGKVKGAVIDRCTPDPDAIAWLLLSAAPIDGAGVFQRVTHIQRVNTVGGNAPADPGSAVGEEARVPYTTEYLFYRAS